MTEASLGLRTNPYGSYVECMPLKMSNVKQIKPRPCRIKDGVGVGAGGGLQRNIQPCPKRCTEVHRPA